MNDEIKLYLEKYPQEIVNLYMKLREILYCAIEAQIEEKMWARLPSYYCAERFVRLIPFNDHINIEASGLALYKEELEGYKFTPKGMMQINPKQSVPNGALAAAFKNTLLS